MKLYRASWGWKEAVRPWAALGCLLAAFASASGTLRSDSFDEEFDLAMGQSVFETTCVRCHGPGKLGAPRVGRDPESWRARIDQGIGVLIEHALSGHGRMPPKGGYGELSEEEVGAAVAYLYAEAQSIIAAGEPVAMECAPSQLQYCSEEERRKLLILHLLWMLSEPR